MKKAGIVLLVLQGVGLFGSLINGTLIRMLANLGSSYGIAEMLGFFAVGIVGISLLLAAKNRENKENKVVIKKCVNCGKILDIEATFCDECGAKQS